MAVTSNRRKFRWALFWSFLLLDIIVFANCILYLADNVGMFHSDNPVDLAYKYEAQDNLTVEQFIGLNLLLENAEHKPLAYYTVNRDGGIALEQHIILDGSKQIIKPQDYNLALYDMGINAFSARGGGMCALTGAGCIVVGGITIGILYTWAKQPKKDGNKERT
jgi:hypothetical protein